MNPTIIHDTIWTGDTGRELRQYPADVRELMFYLMTCPDRNPYGLFLLETDLIEQRLGPGRMPVDRAMEILQSAGFCRWDPRSRWIWIVEMARVQFTTPLRAGDYRVMSTKKWYRTCLRNPFLGPWFDRYAVDFRMASDPMPAERRGHEREQDVMRTQPLSTAPPPAPLDTPSEAPTDRGSRQPLSTVRTSGFELVPSDQDQNLLEQIDPARARLRPEQIDDVFEQLWDIYPNGNQKKDAKTEFTKLKPTGELAETIRRAIYAHRGTQQWIREGGQFVPRMVNWLKRRGWEDRVETTAPVVSDRTLKNVGAVRNFIDRPDDEPPIEDRE